jgi:hypothetical protein
MGNGAFRDASAAIERAAMLEQENEQLRSELADMARLRVELEELATLRAEVVDSAPSHAPRTRALTSSASARSATSWRARCAPSASVSPSSKASS